MIKHVTKMVFFLALALSINSVQTQSRNVGVNLQKKMEQIVQLVNRGRDFLAKNTIESSMRAFSRDPQWRMGEVYIFVLDDRGIFLVNGDDVSLVWKSIIKYKGGDAGQRIFDLMLEKSVRGDWINYEWNNAWFESYVKRVQKGDSFYIIGAGFFPQSQKHTTMQLVKGAVNSYYAEGQDATWSAISNPFGPYIRGDVYVFAYDFNGVCVAHGENPALVGQNLIDLVDSQGKFLIKELIKVAQSPDGKGWVNYEWRGGFKSSYVERVVNPNTKKQYLISAGYYPRIDENTVIGLVNKGVRRLKAAGQRQAFVDFASASPDSEFIYGPLSLFVYNLEGKALVHGENPGFVGQNLIKRQDPTGYYVTKAIINQVKKYGRGWVSYLHKNAYKFVYVELVDLPGGKYIVGAGFYPSSKEQTVKTLVRRGEQYLIDRDSHVAFKAFSDPYGGFYRGDIYLFVYTPKGTVLVNGDNKTIVWENFIKAVDDKGKTVVDELIALAKAGGGWLNYRIRNAKRRVFVKPVEKLITVDGGRQKKETYILGSGYFV